MHWLGCALYVSCRKSVVPTLDSGQIEGNCVSLTRLIRSCQLRCAFVFLLALLLSSHVITHRINSAAIVFDSEQIGVVFFVVC